MGNSNYGTITDGIELQPLSERNCLWLYTATLFYPFLEYVAPLREHSSIANGFRPGRLLPASLLGNSKAGRW